MGLSVTYAVDFFFKISLAKVESDLRRKPPDFLMQP